MTPDQLSDLRNCLGETFEIVQWRNTVSDLHDLEPLVSTCDIIAAVLPPALLAQLVKMAGDKPVIQSVSGRRPTGQLRTLPNGSQEEEFEFVHLRWEVIEVLCWRSKPFHR